MPAGGFHPPSFVLGFCAAALVAMLLSSLKRSILRRVKHQERGSLAGVEEARALVAEGWVIMLVARGWLYPGLLIPCEAERPDIWDMERLEEARLIDLAWLGKRRAAALFPGAVILRERDFWLNNISLS